MTTKYINGSGLSKLLQLISNSVGQALSSISNKLSYNDKVHANLIDVTYDELCDIRNSYTLIPGQYYRIIDYVTTTSQENTMSDGKVRPIIVLAINHGKLSEEAMAHDGCKVWYCLENAANKFAWAGATKPVLGFSCQYVVDNSGRGVGFIRDESLVIEESDITYYGYTWLTGAVDKFNKNSVLWYTEEFPEFTDDYVPHTFYQISDGEMVPVNMDSVFYETEKRIGKGVIYRMIDENGNDLPYDFKSIMFRKPNDETDEKYYYTFYYENTNGKIVDVTTEYIPGVKCYNNVIKCVNIGGKMSIPNNIFQLYTGTNCYNNTFGTNCYNNIFGFNFYNNILGNSCYNNTFGNNCNDNTFGNNCNDNSFIYVNSSDSSQTEILDSIVNCDFSNEYQYNELKHLKPSNTNPAYYLKNVHFCKGIKGHKSGGNIIYNTITIEGELSDNAETKVALNSKCELKIYCEADLIN